MYMAMYKENITPSLQLWCSPIPLVTPGPQYCAKYQLFDTYAAAESFLNSLQGETFSDKILVAMGNDWWVIE